MVESEEKKRIAELEAEIKELKEKLARFEEKRKSTLLKFVQNLKRGDRVEIWWIDASESDVKNLTLPLPDHCVETLHREIGWFVGLQKGDTWRDIHLIFKTRSTDPDTVSSKHKIISIPFATKCRKCGELVTMLPNRVLLLRPVERQES